MTKLQPLGHISPFLIVSDIARAVEFYERLGFEIRALAPDASPFFAIVGRDSVQLYLKNVSADSHTVPPQPNHLRHIWAPWDAFVFVEDPDALSEEFASRGVTFQEPLNNREDGVRGFSVRDHDGYVLFFGRPD
jgi:catechol 2,3-dioxygenase-like lactoylglutathione lyase family enzyme